MILFKESEDGRTFINIAVIVKELYCFLKEEKGSLRILDMKIVNNDLEIKVDGNFRFEDTDIVRVQGVMKDQAEQKFNFVVDEVRVVVV